MSDTVIIRTTDNSLENVINVTIEVENGEIIFMCGEDQDGRPWEVEKIRFNFIDQERAITASRCCTREGAVTLCMEC